MSIFVAIFVLFASSIAFGATAVYDLTWNANTEADLAGYILYTTNNDTGETLIDPVDVGNVTSYQVSVIVPDNATTSIKFELTAHDTSNNESGRSDPLVQVVDFEPPSPPTGLIGTLVEIIVAMFKWIANFFA